MRLPLAVDAIRERLRPSLRWVSTAAPVKALVRPATQRGLVPEGIWARMPVEERLNVACPNGRSFQYVSHAADPIGRYLFWSRRGWEPDTTAVFFELARQARCVIDVGANSGLFSLIACCASADATVVAFEPVPRVHAQLVEHVRINGFESRCHPRAEAVADVAGTAKLVVSDREVPHDAHLGSLSGDARESAIDVRVTTLDDIRPELPPIALVKIDIEGSEDRVIRGMVGILAEDRPAIILECLPGGPAEAIESVLGAFGYRYFHLREEPVPISRLRPDPKLRYRNFLCTTESVASVRRVAALSTDHSVVSAEPARHRRTRPTG